MSFSQMLKILREQNKGKIVFINAGVFYIAVGEDAILLNSKLKLKCTCFKEDTCKVGVPINAIDKHLERIEKLGYSYIVYNFNKEIGMLTVIKEFTGKLNKTNRKNINCIKCKGKLTKPNDIYLLALRRYFQQQIKEYYEGKL